MVGKGIPFQDALKKADEVLLQATGGISSIITKAGVVNVDFADVRTVMKDGGSAIMGTGIGRGDTTQASRAQEIVFLVDVDRTVKMTRSAGKCATKVLSEWLRPT